MPRSRAGHFVHPGSFIQGLQMSPEMGLPRLLHSKTCGCFSSCKNISWGEGSGIYLLCDYRGI